MALYKVDDYYYLLFIIIRVITVFAGERDDISLQLWPKEGRRVHYHDHIWWPADLQESIHSGRWSGEGVQDHRVRTWSRRRNRRSSGDVCSRNSRRNWSARSALWRRISFCFNHNLFTAEVYVDWRVCDLSQTGSWAFGITGDLTLVILFCL